MHRWTLLALAPALALAACGKKEKDFDVQAYCEAQMECAEEYAAEQTDTGGYGGYGYAYASVEACVEGWEAGKAVYEEMGCGAEFDELEYCLANEDLRCQYGSYTSIACLQESLAMSECVMGGFGFSTTSSTSY